MTDAISSAQSALGAFSTSMAFTANNVANLDTDGYKSKDARLSTGPNGQGVQVSGVSEDTSPGALRDGTASVQNAAGDSETRSDMVETSNVDLTRQMVDMTETSQAYGANTAVVRTADDMAGTLLDMVV